MNSIQSPSPYEYQFLASTKEQRVRDYEEMVSEGNEFFTLEKHDEYLASGKPLYFTFRLEDDVVKINMSSKGDKELTAEQIEYLQNTYDMNNLTKTDKMRLLADLSCFGVISGKEAFTDANSINHHLQVPNGWSFVGEIESEASGLRDISDFGEWLNHYANYSRKLDEEIKKLMVNQHSDILDIQKAQSKQEYYRKMQSIFSLIAR